MHALIKNGVVERCPYSLEQLRSDNPSVSFPSTITDSLLANWNVFLVLETSPQYDHRTQNAIQSGCIYDALEAVWKTNWVVTTKTQEEIDSIAAAEAKAVRGIRNVMIAESDWTQLDDTPITNAKKLEWATYRQALRDIPDQAGFPWEVVWPVEPE